MATSERIRQITKRKQDQKTHLESEGSNASSRLSFKFPLEHADHVLKTWVATMLLNQIEQTLIMVSLQFLLHTLNQHLRWG